MGEKEKSWQNAFVFVSGEKAIGNKIESHASASDLHVICT